MTARVRARVRVDLREYSGRLEVQRHEALLHLARVRVRVRVRARVRASVRVWVRFRVRVWVRVRVRRGKVRARVRRGTPSPTGQTARDPSRGTP